MRTPSFTHLADAAVVRTYDRAISNERISTAMVVAVIAEIDARRIHANEGYPSVYAFCVERGRLSEDAAYKRIQAARVVQKFPLILSALEDGRLHLSAVCLLAPHLTSHNVDDLVAAAANKRKSEVERLIAERFPRSELLAMVEALPAEPRSEQPPQLAPYR